MRHGQLRSAAAADPDIDVIERRRAQTDQDLTGPWGGLVYIIDNDLLRSAVLVYDRRFHICLPENY